VFLAVLAVYGAYLLYVGGDRFEFRFLVVVFPYLYGLLGDAACRLWALEAGGPLRALGRPVAAAVAVALLATTVAGSRVVWRDLRHGVAGIDKTESYARMRADHGRFLRRLIDRGDLAPDLLLGVGGAGALPYYTGWPTVDRRGLNDRVVAREPLDERGVIGHEREASYEYLLSRRIVVLDVLNRLVYDDDAVASRRRVVRWNDVWVPLYVYRADGRYVVFGSLLPEEEVRAAFARLERVDPPGGARLQPPA